MRRIAVVLLALALAMPAAAQPVPEPRPRDASPVSDAPTAQSATPATVVPGPEGAAPTATVAPPASPRRTTNARSPAAAVSRDRASRPQPAPRPSPAAQVEAGPSPAATGSAPAHAAALATPRRKPEAPHPAAEAAPSPTVARAGDCSGALRAVGIEATPAPAIAEGVCQIPRPFRVTAAGGVALSAPALMRCEAALALGAWTRDTKAAAREIMGRELTSMRVAAGYVCRTRRGTNRLSEHGRANAIDISAFTFARGETVPVAAQRAGSRAARFQKAARAAACRHFTTVLGPGSDAAHANHFHFDSAQRRGGYRLCD